MWHAIPSLDIGFHALTQSVSVSCSREHIDVMPVTEAANLLVTPFIAKAEMPPGQPSTISQGKDEIA